MRSTLRFLIWTGAILGAIGLLLNLLVFDSWVVPGDDPLFTASVLPALAPEDRILVRRETVPDSTQLARCVHPQDPSKYVVGRVFGRPGETVELRGERIVVDQKLVTSAHACKPVEVVHPVSGQPLTLDCLAEENGAWSYDTLHTSRTPEADVVVKVPEGKLFLVSDNRHIHMDSRDFGVVDASKCEHIVYRLWGAVYLDSSRRNNLLW